MTISPQILARIADPTAGRLESIGKNYANARQASIENARSDEKFQMEKTKVEADFQQQTLDNMYKGNADKRAAELDAREAQDQKMQMAELGSQAMGAYSTSVLDALEKDPSLATDEARMATVQNEIRDSFPDAYKPMIPDTTQSVEELRRGLVNANSIQSALNPTAPKTSFEMDTIQNIDTKEKQSRIKGDPYLEKQIGTNKWIKYFPSTGGTTADIAKKTKGKLQDEQLLAAELQDSVAKLDTMWNEFGKGKMDWLSQGGDALTRVMEKLNLPITEGQKASSGNREKMKLETKKMQTAWRLKITGSQAGKWEIQDLMSQPLNMDDTNSQWEVKIPEWKDAADKIAVRAKLAQTQGFESTGTVKLSDGREMPMWTNPDTGESKAITDFGALGEIPTMKEYMTRELDRRYPNIDAMSDTEVKAAIAQVRQQANSLGYR